LATAFLNETKIFRTKVPAVADPCQVSSPAAYIHQRIDPQESKSRIPV
jgi:hypothetical protein